MDDQAIGAHDALVRCIAGGAPPNWIEFVGHFEIDQECENLLGLFLCDVAGRLVKVDAMEPGRLNYSLYDVLRSFWDAMSHEWNSVTVRIDNSGRYRFAFSRELVRLSEDGDIAHNPTRTLTESIIALYPDRSWDSP